MHWTEYKTDTSLTPREQVRLALKSGAFNQVRGTLQMGDGFCCLGVSCIIAEQNGIEVSRLSGVWELAGGSLTKYQPKVAEWLNLNRDAESTRIGWNDDGQSFKTIARRF